MGGEAENYPIMSPEKIRDIDYDKIVISTSYVYYQEISDCLIKKYGVQERKITRLGWLIVPELCNLGDIEIDSVPGDCYDLQDLIAEKKIVPNNDLENFFFYKNHRVITKWWHYFETYEYFLKKYRNNPIKMLEIGVFRGGSLQMWKEYFKEDSLVVGIDIDPQCKSYEEEGIKICIGSQNDPEFLKAVAKKYGPFDVVLDDGSHQVEHQITSFEVLFPEVRNGGIYICEDIHTSYLPEYNGMFRGKDTFIEYSKNWIDDLHKQHVDKRNQKFISQYADEIRSCHYYENMVILDKGIKKKSISSMLGGKFEKM